MDADDAGDAGDVVDYGHPPKNACFLTPRGDAQKIAKISKNAPEHVFPLGSEVSAQKFGTWSARGRRWVGGAGRTALYLKVYLKVARTTSKARWPDLHAATQPTTGNPACQARSCTHPPTHTHPTTHPLISSPCVSCHFLALEPPQLVGIPADESGLFLGSF